MIYKIEFSEQAEADLRKIFEYIAFTLQSFENAAGQLQRLEKGIMGLNQMPSRFRKYDKEPWQSRGLRIMPIDNYSVFYIPDDSNSIVTIIRVIYGGRDTETELTKS